MFMTLAASDKLSCWEIDDSTGELEFLSDTEIDGRPAPLALDTEKSIIYVGRRDIPRVSSYRFNSSNGSLEHLSDGPILQGDPCYISLDNTSQYLLSAYYLAGGVSVHEVKEGSFEGRNDWISTGIGAHCVYTDATNSMAMLPHIAGENGLNTIRLFRFSEETGDLTPSDAFECLQPDNRGPRHYSIHPNGKFAFFSNEQDCSVTSYEIDIESSSLKEIQTESTLPMHYGGVNTCAQIRLTPDGSFLYAPNRGHDSLAAFSIDPDTGKMKQAGRFTTEAVPRVLDIDNTGQFLYSAGLESGHVSAFHIEGDGSLRLISRYEVGKEPMWLLIHATD